jgi:hypothetical protein
VVTWFPARSISRAWWITYRPLKQTPGKYHSLNAKIAGSRQEQNPFVLYINVESMKYSLAVVAGQIPVRLANLSGDGEEYFSDRVVPFDLNNPYSGQPFDVRQVDRITVTLTLPAGPLPVRQ